jgi:hypothetical protein
MSRVLSALMFLVLAGCASAPHQACLTPTQKPLIVAQLFFGLSIEGRAPVAEAEWADFAARTVTAKFPGGFTVYDAMGQWRGRSGEIVREPSKVLVIVAEDTPALARHLDEIMAAYRARFAQESVGLVTTHACAAF